MAKLCFLILMAFAIVPAVMSSVIKHKPKSCHEIKEFMQTTENGFYNLFDSNLSPYTTYCDFESEPPFIWTLIESVTLHEAQQLENRKSFYYDHPLAECHINWNKFRLSKVRIQSIQGSYGTTHYRVTCNFNPVNGTGLTNHRDYLRGSLCQYTNFYSATSSYYCVRVDYINVRGKLCRKCRVPFYGGNTNHQFVDLGTAATACDRFDVPDKISSEDVFGNYKNVNPQFSCSANSNSTTNWWLGGAFIAEQLIY
ncbi:hypothetical protein TrispH2_001772 [Trichoplax sp. H2]|uniref:Fibrinogen C-terminal domain-containing protein n=1 Tax=Trichoplax adhaerens TaxID=10228 RepID=B3RUF9_TRIAD|nr:predicted protein [Trichoplax adhaerens]EDV25326.1 predicted protein [Trichoplax adhaerens]RDD46045.1 hypothetical protein TrispH2_001772 [Trichoplax sp. H2]|eukprot:XP_002111359.1 predicted protein [Trichoplax adhaerens]